MIPTPHPHHIATRGYLGGAYAIAMRGYMTFPDVVARFPSQGMIEGETWVALLQETGDLTAVVEQYALRAGLSSPLDLDGILESLAWRAFLEEKC